MEWKFQSNCGPFDPPHGGGGDRHGAVAPAAPSLCYSLTDKLVWTESFILTNKHGKLSRRQVLSKLESKHSHLKYHKVNPNATDGTTGGGNGVDWPNGVLPQAVSGEQEEPRRWHALPGPRSLTTVIRRITGGHGRRNSWAGDLNQGRFGLDYHGSIRRSDGSYSFMTSLTKLASEYSPG